MANPSKRKGTAAESAVRDFALSMNVPADRAALSGAADRGDVWLWGGEVVIEVKDCPKSFTHFPRGVLLADWWDQTERESARVSQCAVGLLVAKPKGVSHDNVGDWWCWANLLQIAAWHGGPLQEWHTSRRVPWMVPFGTLLAELADGRRG